MKFDKVIVLGLQQLFMQLLDLCWGCSLFNIVTAGREKISLHESLLHCLMFKTAVQGALSKPLTHVNNNSVAKGSMT